MNERPHARCPEHDLALSPSGQCVMCRRSLAPPPDGGTWLVPVLAIAVVLVAGVVGVRVLVRALTPPPAPRPPAPVAEIAVSPTTEPEPARRPRTPWASTPRRDREDDRSAAPETPVAPEPSPSGADPVLAATRPRVSITVYSASWRPSCRRAEAYLREHHIRYTERDVDVARNGERLHELNPRNTIPTFENDDLTQGSLDVIS